jgi:hypothetical protein
MNPVKKKNVQVNAELKTLSDYALILQHVNGYSVYESIELANKSAGEPLFMALLKNNIELFTTGSVVLK